MEAIIRRKRSTALCRHRDLFGCLHLWTMRNYCRSQSCHKILKTGGDSFAGTLLGARAKFFSKWLWCMIVVNISAQNRTISGLWKVFSMLKRLWICIAQNPTQRGHCMYKMITLSCPPMFRGIHSMLHRLWLNRIGTKWMNELIPNIGRGRSVFNSPLVIYTLAAAFISLRILYTREEAHSSKSWKYWYATLTLFTIGALPRQSDDTRCDGILIIWGTRYRHVILLPQRKCRVLSKYTGCLFPVFRHAKSIHLAGLLLPFAAGSCGLSSRILRSGAYLFFWVPCLFWSLNGVLLLDFQGPWCDRAIFYGLFDLKGIRPIKALRTIIFISAWRYGCSPIMRFFVCGLQYWICSFLVKRRIFKAPLASLCDGKLLCFRLIFVLYALSSKI